MTSGRFVKKYLEEVPISRLLVSTSAVSWQLTYSYTKYFWYCGLRASPFLHVNINATRYTMDDTECAVQLGGMKSRQMTLQMILPRRAPSTNKTSWNTKSSGQSERGPGRRGYVHCPPQRLYFLHEMIFSLPFFFPPPQSISVDLLPLFSIDSLFRHNK